MFGESDSESPRVPSPWDSLISTPCSSSPASRSPLSSSPTPATAYIPRLVPESDEGNVEYKLQLLSPSPARFARLVTQLKWRLLEGGGQAYYELGVADSGALVGLPRVEMEQSLETLEMMAGEIGASIIVVKEIEVPLAMSEYAVATSTDDHRRIRKPDIYLDGYGTGDTSTETDGATDSDAANSSDAVFTMDSELENTPSQLKDTPGLSSSPKFSIDLEISKVYKPRTTRTRFHSTTYHHDKHQQKGCGKKTKKEKSSFQKERDEVTKSEARRAARDRRRAAKQQREVLANTEAAGHTTEELAHVAEEEAEGDQAIVTQTSTLHAPVGQADADDLAYGLEQLHVSFDSVPVVPEDVPSITIEGDDNDDGDLFPSYRNAQTEHLNSAGTSSDSEPQKRLIVEALVVRKMSLDEGFLDFGGFGLI